MWLLWFSGIEWRLKNQFDLATWTVLAGSSSDIRLFHDTKHWSLCLGRCWPNPTGHFCKLPRQQCASWRRLHWTPETETLKIEVLRSELPSKAFTGPVRTCRKTKDTSDGWSYGREPKGAARHGHITPIYQLIGNPNRKSAGMGSTLQLCVQLPT